VSRGRAEQCACTPSRPIVHLPLLSVRGSAFGHCRLAGRNGKNPCSALRGAAAWQVITSGRRFDGPMLAVMKATRP